MPPAQALLAGTWPSWVKEANPGKKLREVPAFEGARALAADLDAAPGLPCAARRRLRAALPLPGAPATLLPLSAAEDGEEQGARRASSVGLGDGGAGLPQAAVSPWLPLEGRGHFHGWSNSAVYHASLAAAGLPRPPCAVAQALLQQPWPLLAGAVKRPRERCEALGEGLLLSV